MYRGLAKTKGNDGRQSIGPVLSAGFALAHIFSVDDEALGIIECFRISISCGSGTDKLGSFRDEAPKALNFMFRLSMCRKHGRRVPQCFQVSQFHQAAIGDRLLMFFRVR